MTYALTWLPEVLEAAGLKVAETPDWRTRGRAEMGKVMGVMCHHTGTAAGGNMPTLDMLIKGRPDLRGPLCQLGLGRDGTFYIVAAGRANHAGPGQWERVSTGNSSFIGIEAEHSGREQDEWPEAQLDAYKRGVAAILKHVGAGANMCCGHKEWAPRRKPDPTFDMASFRSAVGELLAGKSPPPPIPPRDSSDRPTLRRGRRSDAVKELQKLLGLEADGIFGGRTEAVVRAWQRANDLVPDGIVGPRSWEMLVGQPPNAGAELVPAVLATKTEKEDKVDLTVIDEIDLDLLRLAFPQNTATELKRWVEPLKTACRRYGIDTKREICSFLANIDVESRSLTRMSESLNYSVEGLLRTFGRHRISEADARRLGRKPGEPSLSMQRQEQIANILYGGEWGRKNLGNTEPGDGWRFRGYGPKQITGRSNCAGFGESVGLDIDQVPAFLRTPEGGCLGAGWFWKTHDLDKFAATPGLADDRRAINGGVLGLEVVQERFDVLFAELAKRSKAG
jgi:predicted chitinase/peptidoglycan hydrolase-like protein with peptidoglycan-binding domain